MKKLASTCIGDGKTPNKYFVFQSNDYAVYNPKENCLEWCGDIYPDHVSEGESVGVYKTFKEALRAYEELENQSEPPTCDGIHRVTMEDRITGVIMETEWVEYQSKSPNGRYNIPTFEFERNDDTGFTREKLGSKFI